ncbi:hypothetical protein KKH27_05275 [bacterium]|nr:hypothetical protein [bacterium]MBU1983061.1 hypothetical protein [bacterium]
MRFSVKLHPALGSLTSRLVVLIVLVVAGPVAAQLEPDSLQTPDSLSTDLFQWEMPGDTIGIASDSTVAAGVVESWLKPLGIILVTCTTVFLLYTVRSR